MRPWAGAETVAKPTSKDAIVTFSDVLILYPVKQSVLPTRKPNLKRGNQSEGFRHTAGLRRSMVFRKSLTLNVIPLEEPIQQRYGTRREALFRFSKSIWLGKPLEVREETTESPMAQRKCKRKISEELVVPSTLTA